MFAGRVQFPWHLRIGPREVCGTYSSGSHPGNCAALSTVRGTFQFAISTIPRLGPPKEGPEFSATAPPSSARKVIGTAGGAGVAALRGLRTAST